MQGTAFPPVRYHDTRFHLTVLWRVSNKTDKCSSNLAQSSVFCEANSHFPCYLTNNQAFVREASKEVAHNWLSLPYCQYWTNIFTRSQWNAISGLLFVLLVVMEMFMWHSSCRKNVVLIRMHKSVYCNLNILTFNVHNCIVSIKCFKIMAKTCWMPLNCWGEEYDWLLFFSLYALRDKW